MTSAAVSPLPGGVDVVVPFYNEATVLTQLCQQFIHQVDDRNQPIDSSAWRVIAVNNASTDNSVEILTAAAQQPGMPELIVIDEPVKGVVRARQTGAQYALRSAAHNPYLLHIDADNQLPAGLIADVSRRLASGQSDVLAYAGHFSWRFWRQVPQLAQRYYAAVGTLEFCPQTCKDFGFSHTQALLTPQLYQDFVRVPNQLGLAMTKISYVNCGGYFSEYAGDGKEILGEARNIWHRLDRAGANLAYAEQPFITLNPRRLLADPERWCAGRSYAGGMSDFRSAATADAHARLNRLAAGIDFAPVRRNIIKRFIIETCVAKPERIAANREYFAGVLEPFRASVYDWHHRKPVRNYADVLPLVLELTARYAEMILENIRQIRGIGSADGGH